MAQDVRSREGQGDGIPAFRSAREWGRWRGIGGQWSRFHAVARQATIDGRVTLCGAPLSGDAMTTRYPPEGARCRSCLNVQRERGELL